MQSDQAWKEESRPIEKLDIEIGFLLQSDFYLGDPDDFEQLNDPVRHEPLQPPAIARAYDDCVLTAEALGHEDELIAYYRRVAERAAALGKDFNEIRHYFWIRLYLWNKTEDVAISFPWYDSLAEIRQFTQWLAAASTAPFWDIEQGWQVEAVRESGDLHVRQSDPDGGEEYANLKVPIEPVAALASEVEVRVSAIIERLTAGLGVDVWSKYLPDARFGHNAWQP